MLGEFETVREVVLAVRRLGARSDRVLKALLDRPASDRLVVPVAVVGFVPVVLARCRDRDLVDEFIGELSIELVLAQRDGPPATSGLLGARLIDRAWDRVRAPLRRPEPTVPFDPGDLGWERADSAWGPERLALGKVALFEVRDAVANATEGREPLVRAWNSAIELADREGRTEAERDRWKYVRRQLRRRVGGELVA